MIVRHGMALAFLATGFLLPGRTVWADEPGAPAGATSESAYDQARLEARLTDRGLSPTEAGQLMASMTPDELNFYAENPEQVQVAGDGAVVLLLVVAVAILVYLLVEHHHRHS